jgi:hypothetical protein
LLEPFDLTLPFDPTIGSPYEQSYGLLEPFNLTTVFPSV